MVYNKANFWIEALAVKDYRNFSNEIHITKDYTEVTNGHYAVRVSTPKNKEELIKEFPMLNSKKFIELEKGCTISKEFAKAVGEAIPKNSTMPILENTITVESTDEELEFAVTNLEVTRSLRGRKLSGIYPNVDIIIPKGDGEHVISANVDYLIKILQQYKKMKIDTARFDFYGDTQPIKITGTDKDKGQECLSILMPVKIE